MAPFSYTEGITVYYQLHVSERERVALEAEILGVAFRLKDPDFDLRMKIIFIIEFMTASNNFK